MTRCTTHRVPRARLDPIDCEFDALTLIVASLHCPLDDQTIVVLLDHERRGLSILSVAGTPEPDSMFDVIDTCVALTLDHPDLGAVVLASVRPEHPVDPADVDRWLEASQQCSDAGIDLLEWFVVSDGISCPRDLLGEAPRWSR